MHVLLHLEECTRVRVCGRKGTSYSLGYGATQQIGRNLTLIYPTLGLGPGHVPQRSDIFFPWKGSGGI